MGLFLASGPKQPQHWNFIQDFSATMAEISKRIDGKKLEFSRFCYKMEKRKNIFIFVNFPLF